MLCRKEGRLIGTESPTPASCPLPNMAWPAASAAATSPNSTSRSAPTLAQSLSRLRVVTQKAAAPIMLPAMRAPEEPNRRTHSPDPRRLIDLLADRLTRFARGEISRLLICVPPRSLKSELCSVVFPAWLMARDVTTQLLCVSYAQPLAKDFERHSRGRSGHIVGLASLMLATGHSWSTQASYLHEQGIEWMCSKMPCSAFEHFLPVIFQEFGMGQQTGPNGWTELTIQVEQPRRSVGQQIPGDEEAVAFADRDEAATAGTRLTLEATMILRIDPLPYWEPIALSLRANVRRVSASARLQAEGLSVPHTTS